MATVSEPRVAIVGMNPAGRFAWDLKLQQLAPGARRAGRLTALSSGELLVWECDGEFMGFTVDTKGKHDVRWRFRPEGSPGLERYALPAPGGRAVLVAIDPPIALRPLPLELPAGDASLFIRLRNHHWAAVELKGLERGESVRVTPEFQPPR